MRKPAISAQPMAMADRLPRPWFVGAAAGILDYASVSARAGFGVEGRRAQNGTVRLEGLGGGTG